MLKDIVKKTSTMNSMHNSNLIAAAVGATIGVVSVAAVLIYNKVMEKQQHATMCSNLDKVNRKVVELQAELEELRTQQLNLQKSKRRKVNRKTPVSNDNTFSGTDDLDAYSIAGTDIGDDEFFDCSDSEGGEDLENVQKQESSNGESEFRAQLKQIDKDLEDKTLQTSLYPMIKELFQHNSENPEVVWRFARVCYYCSERAPDKEKKKEYIFEGISACEKILHIEHGPLYKWYAILIGIKSSFLATKDKIENGYIFKTYVEKALEIMPKDNYLHHLLGRFKYELAGLSWVERKIAGTLFAEVPKSSYQEAIQHFETSEKLASKPYYENKLFLGKCYIAMGQNEKAKNWLLEIDQCPESCKEELKVRNDAKKLLAKCS